MCDPPRDPWPVSVKCPMKGNGRIYGSVLIYVKPFRNRERVKKPPPPSDYQSAPINELLYVVSNNLAFC